MPFLCTRCKEFTLICLLFASMELQARPSVKFLSPRPNSTAIVSISESFEIEIFLEDLPHVPCTNYNLALHSIDPARELQQISLCTCAEDNPQRPLPSACYVDLWMLQVFFWLSIFLVLH